ncbi:MATE family efflux transporter [Fluoribacter dumoffii]|uniref:Multidrug-efflux transporter n=1 Tax=Fluoribacter dumoffii TaxID=463 RepID=A0A377G880_9GAMM|nr:MATE family efflux transporter [Fluoribacter dumoffii]KTC89894.1 MATE efflux family protein [Fluoribacter dumoffii NY 23]MCW8385192.1 MATE family efflux transporter [Fluoribacter dumoffii]MCW8418246.1 MATE family efflux transporter [Fluoribacter dumoffii]MCW8453912.1 MATE family efflux transporter [Fluoribacter dumoffii]MCW8462017.1 MATE family efflux transporter [Fluoribacter dumoffii]
MKSFKSNFQSLFNLAVPLVLTGLLQSSVYFFVTVFLAHVSQHALAAGSLVAWLFATFNVIIIGILNSINILVAHRYGAKDHHGICLVFRDGFWLAFILTIPTWYFFWHFAPLLVYFGQDQALVKLTESYLHALTWGLLANFISVVLMEFVIGLGKTRLALVFSMLNVSLNILFSFVLIFGKFGFPALGVAGAGWGTTIGSWITGLTFCWYIFTNKNYKPYTQLLFTYVKPFYQIELLKIGTPLGIMYCVEVGFFFALILVMGSLGSQMLAANQIALQYLCILISIIFSIAQAITVRVGHLLGEGDLVTAKHAGLIGTFTSVIFMFCAALVYWFFPKILIGIDFDIQEPGNQMVLHFAIQLLAVSAIFQIFESARISLFGALRALKDTRYTLFISILSFWGIALPLGYLFAIPMGWGGVGLWWGMSLAAFISVLLLYWRFNFKIRHYRTTT